MALVCSPEWRYPVATSPSETTQQRLDPDAIAAVDTSDLLTDIVGLPEHLRDAKWKVESAQLSPWDSPRGVIVAGMGGSGGGGLLAPPMLGGVGRASGR